MADVFKKRTTTYTLGGRTVRAGTTGAAKRTRLSKKWYGTAGGKQVPLSTDKQAARQLLAALGESGMVLTGGLLMASGLALAVFSPGWMWFIPVELMLGLGFFTLHGVLQARATEMLPAARGTAVATFACALFIGQSLGALLIGAGIARLGYGQAFLLNTGAILLLGVWLWRTLRRHPSTVHA